MIQPVVGVVGAIPLPLIGAQPEEHVYEQPDITVVNDFPDHIEVKLVEEQMPFHNAASVGPEYVKDWDSFIGQEPMKREIQVYIDEAMIKWRALPHVLLASGMAGAGKTTLARLIAKQMDGELFMLVPPFTRDTLYEAAMAVPEYGFLFIDEIHKIFDNGKAAAENLYHLMEERVLYLEGGVHRLHNFTLIGATTDKGKLTDAFIERFSITPFFQPYSLAELVRIAHNFTLFYGEPLLPETLVAIAKACRGTPRVCRELVQAAKALQVSTGNMTTPQALLAFKQVTPDGMTRQHKAYVMAMFQFFGREKDDGGWEYIAGEASMMSLLRETKGGVARLERFLIERGLVDRTPRGRRLTDRGAARAREWIETDGRLNSE